MIGAPVAEYTVMSVLEGPEGGAHGGGGAQRYMKVDKLLYKLKDLYARHWNIHQERQILGRWGDDPGVRASLPGIGSECCH